jgi:hypothetical protein
MGPGLVDKGKNCCGRKDPMASLHCGEGLNLESQGEDYSQND